jgi:hypothetical protein
MRMMESLVLPQSRMKIVTRIHVRVSANTIIGRLVLSHVEEERSTELSFGAKHTLIALPVSSECVSLNPAVTIA